MISLVSKILKKFGLIFSHDKDLLITITMISVIGLLAFFLGEELGSVFANFLTQKNK